MQFSKRTIEILKNFVTVNRSILFKEGKELLTKSNANDVFASANIEETIPQEFGIYDISQFLSVISLFNEPELTFNDKFVIVNEKGKTKGGIKYWFTQPHLIVAPTKKIDNSKFESSEKNSFVLTQEALSRIMKSSAALAVKDVTVVCDKDGIVLVVHDRKNPSSNDSSEVLSEESQDVEAKHLLKVENLNFLPGDYNVSIYKDKLAVFTSKDGNVVYAVALQKP